MISALAPVMRASSVARVVLLLALLCGIVTMHAVAVMPGHQPHGDTVAMATTGAHHANDTSCGDDGCGSGHSLCGIATMSGACLTNSAASVW